MVNQYERNETVDEALLWEMIQLQIRDTSVKYSKTKTKKMNNKETDIENYSRSRKAVGELHKQRQRSSC